MSRMIAVGRWTRYVLLVAVAATALVLIVTAVVRGAAGSDAAPVPEQTAEPVAMTTPEPATPQTDPEARFLALDGGGVLWRGVAGSCAEGIQPTLERTADAIAWSSATPDDAAELLALVPGGARDQALVAIALDDGSCTPAGRATTADGQGWEDAGAPYPAHAELPDGGLVATEDGYVALAAADCEGVSFMAADGSWVACDPSLDPDAPLAIDYADGRLYVWSGDVLTSLEVVAAG